MCTILFSTRKTYKCVDMYCVTFSECILPRARIVSVIFEEIIDGNAFYITGTVYL